MKTLRDRRNPASDRLIAAELAGDLTVMDDQMADLLLSIVRSADEPDELRGKAAISLGPALEQTDTEGFDDDLSEPSIRKETFEQIQEAFRTAYLDVGTPKEVRRRVLEASVRAGQDWHQDAIRDAYSSGDEEWTLTAVFCMQWIPGFSAEILDTLESRNPDIQYEAVRAAGDQELDAAWPHVAALLASKTTEKPLLLAAIEAAASIRPLEARAVLAELSDSEDEDIAEAAGEALLMAAPVFDEDADEDEDDGQSHSGG
jgi:hypothetical protein